jgi:hypothetical protein
MGPLCNLFLYEWLSDQFLIIYPIITKKPIDSDINKNTSSIVKIVDLILYNYKVFGLKFD